MDLIIAIIVAIVILAVALWAIGELAPANLQRPLHVVVIAIFVVWLLLRVWPRVAELL